MKLNIVIMLCLIIINRAECKTIESQIKTDNKSDPMPAPMSNLKSYPGCRLGYMRVGNLDNGLPDCRLLSNA